jgi:hypothetical protein
LDSATLPDLCPFLNFNERPDERFIANSAPIQIDWLHDRDVFTKRYIDNPCMPNFWLRHKDLA